MSMNKNRYFIARLAGDIASLSYSELISIISGEGYEITDSIRIDEFVIFRTMEKAINILIKRASTIVELGILIDIVSDIDEVLKLVLEYYDKGSGVCIDIDSIRGFGKEEGLLLYRKLVERGFTRYRNCTRKIRAVFLLGMILVYEIILRRRIALYSDREPHKRPYYRPGTMKPVLARLLINLAKISTERHDTILDPFCGVGGIAIEACLMGFRVYCSDIDMRMVLGSKINSISYKCDNMIDIILSDATLSPYRYNVINAIVTDPPYGIQTVPRSQSMENLLKGFIRNASDALKSGRFMVFAVPLQYADYTEEVLYDNSFNIAEKHLNKVHSSLTRVIYVVQRK
ncbi:putative RNA methylase [Ignisphaera aggregans DSM 17230]|uniref:tRNA (guanine(10)-N(2))-dimethyltransferase n=1 Tax=Ignisphaera aggregans (strain DSM 17230 / JCM 13409 / AQ1.S1) TaxID=583356 RepID=E0SP42_IGNAA|nr:putative RNA methylase [Ignisphaera aggregans DSM 17230]